MTTPDLTGPTTQVLARMLGGRPAGDHGLMTPGPAAPRRARRALAVAVAVWLAGAGLLAYSTLRPGGTPGADNGFSSVVALVPAAVLGLLVFARRPGSPVGPALVGLAAAPALTWGLENWGGSFGTPQPWPAARLVGTLLGGVWVGNLAGFVLLCRVFPDGRLPGRRWSLLPWLFAAVALLVNAVITLDPHHFAAAGGPLPGATPVRLPPSAWTALDVAAGLAFLAVLSLAVSSLVVRHRIADERTRTQLRWLVLGAGTVPVLLAAGWVADAAGASNSVAYSGFVVAIVIAIPAAVAVAILRYDLLDVDRLLSASVSWLLTAVVSAAIFATVVLGAGDLGGRSRVGSTAGAFVVALCLLPLHHRVTHAVARVLDRERTVTVATLRRFVAAVRDGTAAPEEVETVLRRALDDPELTVLLRLPGADGYVDLAGEPRSLPATDAVPLHTRDTDVGALVLGRSSARRVRRARLVAVEVRLPIEVSRLQMALRRALADTRLSQGRLVEAVALERRRLERDLHDGAQQRILAVGMRLRSVQQLHGRTTPTHAELDAAVDALEATVHELRRLSHGIRPGRLDDGLAVAVRDLVTNSPIPVDIEVGSVAVSEAAATTAYYIVAECLANTLKHAAASRAAVTITQAGQRLVVRVVDDGRGGVSPVGLTALRDRVLALGGEVDIVSPAGAGTTVLARFQGGRGCASSSPRTRCCSARDSSGC